MDQSETPFVSMSSGDSIPVRVAGSPSVMSDDFTYDWVMVFSVPANPFDADSNPPMNFAASTIVASMSEAGLRTKLYKSVQGDEVYCLIGASEPRLEKEAERVEYDLMLDRDKAVRKAADKGVILAQKTLNKDEFCNKITSRLWEGIYVKYKREHRDIYRKYSEDGHYHEESVFRGTDRIKLIISIIEAEKTLGGAGISTGNAMKVKNAHLKAFFPLHDPDRKLMLEKKWVTWKSLFSMPIDDIRDYFGEEIGLYFAFLQFYNRALAGLSIVGVIFAIVLFSRPLAQAEGIWIFGIIVALWGSLMMELWKRTSARLQVAWGMANFTLKEQPRPEFSGDFERSIINGRLEESFPFYKRVMRLLCGQTVVLSLIAVVIGAVAGIFILRSILLRKSAVYGAAAAALINAVVIQIFNTIYTTVALKLNDYENHKTDTSYFNSLISKNFLFKFVNSFNTLFYIAFFRQIDDPINRCTVTGGGCLRELAIQLGILFGTMIILNNTLEVLLPYIFNKIAAYKESSGGDKAQQAELESRKSFPEKEFELSQYESTLGDYEELAIQFGYVCLFVTAFPLSPVLALFNNLIEIQVDSAKVLRFVRRPEPRGAADIGAWTTVFSIISFISIATNILMGVIYSRELVNFFNRQAANSGLSATETRARIILWQAIFAAVLEHIILIIKFSIEVFTPDESEEVSAHKARQIYIQQVLIDGSSEEPEDTDSILNKGAAPAEAKDAGYGFFFKVDELGYFSKDDHTRF